MGTVLEVMQGGTGVQSYTALKQQLSLGTAANSNISSNYTDTSTSNVPSSATLNSGLTALDSSLTSKISSAASDLNSNINNVQSRLTASLNNLQSDFNSSRYEVIEIERGGTGATSVSEALVNLSAVSKSGDQIHGSLVIRNNIIRDDVVQPEMYSRNYPEDLVINPYSRMMMISPMSEETEGGDEIVDGGESGENPPIENPDEGNTGDGDIGNEDGSEDTGGEGGENGGGEEENPENPGEGDGSGDGKEEPDEPEIPEEIKREDNYFGFCKEDGVLTTIIKTNYQDNESSTSSIISRIIKPGESVEGEDGTITTTPETIIDSSLSITTNIDGTSYATAPHPDEKSNTNHIATSKWVNDRISAFYQSKNQPTILSGNQMIGIGASETNIINTSGNTEITFIEGDGNLVAEKLICLRSTAETTLVITGGIWINELPVWGKEGQILIFKALFALGKVLLTVVYSDSDNSPSE